MPRTSQKVSDNDDEIGMEAEERECRQRWDEEMLALRANEVRMAQKSVDNESSLSNWSLNESQSSSKQTTKFD